jgi:hypothetical protein
MEFVGLDLEGDEVALHAFLHVGVGPLEHELEVVLVTDLVKLPLRTLKEVRLTEQVVLHLELLIVLLL